MTDDAFRLTMDDEPDPLECLLDDLRGQDTVNDVVALRWYLLHRAQLNKIGWYLIDYPPHVPSLYHPKSRRTRQMINGDRWA